MLHEIICFNNKKRKQKHFFFFFFFFECQIFCFDWYSNSMKRHDFLLSLFSLYICPVHIFLMKKIWRSFFPFRLFMTWESIMNLTQAIFYKFKVIVKIWLKLRVKTYETFPKNYPFRKSVIKSLKKQCLIIGQTIIQL